MNPTLLVVGVLAICIIGILVLRFVPIPKKRESAAVERQKKKTEKEKKKLADLRKIVNPLPAPPPVPVPSEPNTVETQGEVKSLAEFPIGTKLGIELTRIKEGTITRITISKGKVKIKGKDPRKLLFFAVGKSCYHINPKKIIKVSSTSGNKKVTVSYKLAYDVLYGEALNQDGSIEWDDELEMILTDSGMDQYVTIAAYEGGFQLTPTLKKVMLILGAVGFIGGLAINGAAHVIPTVLIHWVP